MNGDSHNIGNLLRSRPEQWAQVRSYASFNSVKARAKQIRHGTVSAFAPSGSFEASVRRVKGDEFLLFARYVGAERINPPPEVEPPRGFKFVEQLPPPAGKVNDDHAQHAIVAWLCSHPNGQRTLRAGLTIRQAQRLASRVRAGDLSSFRPAGAYDAHVERDSTGRYAVRVTVMKLDVPKIAKIAKITAEHAAGWLAGVAWYQENLGGDLIEMQRVVDRYAALATAS